MKLNAQEQLERIARKLRQVSEGVFSFSTETPNFITRDKGLYAYIYARAVKRLAATLAVDREILVLISTFEDQQQRTIKTAKEIISESDGRLESTVAIIVHNDREGSTKLTTWGRSVGLAVLPVYFGKMPATSEELERHLAYQLFCHDPFDVTGPVSDDVNFFGRRTEAQDLARKLQSGQIRSCLGIRKIGKTSIINRIISEVRDHHACKTIFLDCSKDEIWQLDPAGLMSALIEAVADLATSDKRYAAVQSPVSVIPIAKSVQYLLAELKRTPEPILIFIDEVDYVTPGSPTAAHWADGFNVFWRNFRAAYQEAIRENCTLSVMVGGVSSKWFSVGSINDVENAALALIPEEYLTPLARNANAAMIRKLSRSAGLEFPSESVSLIASHCSDMPFWVRKACSYIHKQVEISCRPISLDPQRVQQYLSEFIEREGTTLAQVAVQHLFRVYPELEPICMASLETEAASQVKSPLITVLRNYGVLAEKDPLRPSGEMVKHALLVYKQNKISQALEPSGAGNGAESEKESRALSDWADDLAVINKERNIVEKQLRSMVLNFIKMNNIATKQRGTTRDRILACLGAERRPKLAQFAADELIEKLLWTELVALIVREWTLFAAVFGDRKQFEIHASITNDRADAHAKDVDQLDVAMYRRSLKWLSERITSI